MYFVGVTISIPEHDFNTFPSLLEEFENTCVSHKTFGNTICLYYKNRIDDNIKLENFELQRFINQLKRVHSDKLYNSYNDNLGYHRVILGIPENTEALGKPEKKKRKIIIRKRK